MTPVNRYRAVGAGPHRRRLRIAGFGLAAALLLGGCGGDGASQAAARDERSAPSGLPVRAAEVAPRDLSRRVRVSAPVEPLRTIELAARTSGILDEVRVEEGDRVEQDEVLARIDVTEQEAELARARANLRERRTHFERMERLREQDHVDAASYESARAELEIAESEVALWRTRVGFGTVRSSIDGTVVERHVEPGEAVSQHAPLFDLADMSALVVRAGVSELDLRNLHVGQFVPVRLDAASDANPVHGTIRRIFPSAEPHSRLITVEVALREVDPERVRPGFLARLELMVDALPEALAVPAGAIARQGEAHFVMVIDEDERLVRREIEPGVTRGPWREVRAGLEPGERIVASNPLEMTEGEPVRIVGWAS